MQTTQNMSQAKTLTPVEIEQVLNYIATQNFPLRNRVMLLTGLFSGMRVGEISSLSIGDVMNTDRTVKAEVRLTAEQTKGRQPRTVFLPQKLRDELIAYLVLRTDAKPEHPLFVTAGRKRFSANVMAQHFHYLFKRAGIAGAGYGANVLMLVNFDTLKINARANVNTHNTANWKTTTASETLGPISFTLSAGPFANSYIITPAADSGIPTFGVVSVNSGNTFLLQAQNDRGTGVCQKI